MLYTSQTNRPHPHLQYPLLGIFLQGRAAQRVFYEQHIGTTLPERRFKLVDGKTSPDRSVNHRLECAKQVIAWESRKTEAWIIMTVPANKMEEPTNLSVQLANNTT